MASASKLNLISTVIRFFKYPNKGPDWDRKGNLQNVASLIFDHPLTKVVDKLGDVSTV